VCDLSRPRGRVAVAALPLALYAGGGNAHGVKRPVAQEARVQHRAYIMRIRPDKLHDYVQIHRKENIWQSVIDGLKDAGFTRMIILQQGQQVILFEEAEDLKKAYHYLETNETSRRWEEMMAAWMDQAPRFDELKGDIEFEEIPIIFYFETGELKH
jgi:L-rhamnose mutarotase